MWPFRSSKPRSTAAAARRRHSYRPRLEGLEDRCLLTAGALDPTFGNGARCVTTSLCNSADEADSVLVQPDGKILAAGAAWSAGGIYQAGPVRYNANGSLDNSFGTGGEVLGPTEGTSTVNSSVALYPTTGTSNDGKIVLASFCTSFSVARYNPNGSLDSSFGTNGSATASFGSTLGTAFGTSSAVIQPDGKIVAVGTSSDEKTLELARFNTDGSLDTTFGQGGLVTTTLVENGLAEGSLRGQTLLLQPDSGLIVTTDAAGGGKYHWALVGYNADGSLNNSFGTGGIVNTRPVGSNGDLTQGGSPLSHGRDRQ
jgi:uncharacterized delta-60 repeat protein